jgi:cephalosporin-C deacetylase
MAVDAPPPAAAVAAVAPSPATPLPAAVAAVAPSPATPAPSTAVRLVFDAYPVGHIFTGDELVLPTRVENITNRTVACVVSTWLSEYRPSEDGVPVAEDEQRISLRAGESLAVPTTFHPPAAGPYEFRVMVTEADQPLSQAESTLIFNPAAWQLPEYEPADFDAFWQTTLSELRTRPLDPQEGEPVNRPKIPETFREVSFNGLGDRRIRGYFALPLQYQAGQRVPAILSLPSAGYHCAALDAWAISNGYASLAISIHDLPFDPESGRDHPKALWFEKPYQGMGRESKETYYYRAAYVAGPRAVDYLRSRPEIDPAKIVVTGFSQGGSLALATAALVPDIALLEAGIAGRSRMDLVTFTYKANMTLEPPEGMTSQQMLDRTLAYYDASFFARRVRCPALTRISLDDETNPGPLQYWAYLRLASSPDSRLMIAPWRQHSLPPDVNKVIPAMRQQYAPVGP